MALIVNMRDARTQFSKLVSRAQAGEEILIARYGKPVARLVALDTPLKRRTLGAAKGKVKIMPGFDDAVPGFEEYYR